MGETTEKQIKYFHHVGILKRYFNKDIHNYFAKNPGQVKALETTKAYIDSLPCRIEHGDSMVFCGSPGSGKTHLGFSIIKRCMASKIPTKYITVPELIRLVRSTYKNTGDTVDQLVKDLSVIKILVIDEVGFDAGKECTTTLFDIIDTRYRHQLPTIIISNLNKQKLTDYVGVRVMDRLAEGNGVIVAFYWPSFRIGNG